MRGSIRMLFSCLLATASVAGGVSAWAASPGDGAVSFQPPAGALIAPGEAPDLLVLYTGDVIGYVDACG